VVPGPTARIAALALLAALALVPARGRAQEQEEAHDAAETHAGPHGHHEYRNGLALFLGGTLETAEDQTFGTIGLEYERRLADRWAFQIVAEHVNDFDAQVLAAPVGFRLGGTLWAVAGPGLETEPRRRFRRPEPHGESHTTDHDEGEGPFFLWRLGLVYGIHLGESGRFGVLPSFSLDLVREHGAWVEAWVFGVAVSYHF
jgi:hypothetical protein